MSVCPQGYAPKDAQNSPNSLSARLDFGLWTMPETDRTSGDRTLLSFWSRLVNLPGPVSLLKGGRCPLISDWRLSSGSNTLEARVTQPLGRLSPFDAVPFLASPHFAAPRPFCVVAAEREGKKQGKEIVKLGDGLANVAWAIAGPACSVCIYGNSQQRRTFITFQPTIRSSVIRTGSASGQHLSLEF